MLQGMRLNTCFPLIVNSGRHFHSYPERRRACSTAMSMHTSRYIPNNKTRAAVPTRTEGQPSPKRKEGLHVREPHNALT